MTGLIIPPIGARACIHCSAWRPWDEVAVYRESANGLALVGRRPIGQCRAAPPTIDPDAVGPETAAWPVVGADDACRAFERRAERGEAA